MEGLVNATRLLLEDEGGGFGKLVGRSVDATSRGLDLFRVNRVLVCLQIKMLEGLLGLLATQVEHLITEWRRDGSDRRGAFGLNTTD